MIRYLSLFSGIEAATIAWHPLGWEPVAFAEVDSAACAVLKHHYPAVPNLGDVTKITREMVEALGHIDLVVAGSPCQDFSVAGLRVGISGDRGNLTLEFMRFLKRHPVEWVVWENVPGVLSIDGGNTARELLDAFEELGYVVDVDILDAQYFGVPQRRRRVFICAQSAETLLRQKTTSSALTIAQCLSEILHGVLVASSDPYTNAPASSERRSLSSDGVRRRMKLFGLLREDSSAMLLDNLAEEIQRCATGQGVSASTGANGMGTNPVVEGLLQGIRLVQMEELCDSWSTGQWLQSVLDALSVVRKSFTTLTATTQTTQTEIYTCSMAVLSIARLIAQSNASSPCFWSAGLSTLTALREFTNYARSASSQLFTDPQWVCSWHDFIEQAEPLLFLIGNIGVRPNTSEVLPLSESLQGHPAPRREARQVAPTLPSRRAGGGGLGTDFDCDGGLIQAAFGGNNCSGSIQVATALNVCGSASGRMDFESETFIAHSLRGDGLDASEDGTGRGTPLVPVVSNTLKGNRGNGGGGIGPEETLVPVAIQAGALRENPESGPDGIGVRTDGLAYTLEARAEVQAVAFRACGQDGFTPSQIAPPVTSTDGGGAGVPTIAFTCKDHGAVAGAVSPTLRGMGHDGSHANAGGQVAVAFGIRSDASRSGEALTPSMDAAGRVRLRNPGLGIYEQLAPTVDASAAHTVATSVAIRRLTPVECARLQGFADDYLTQVHRNGKPLADGPMYKMLGNSIATPCLLWIGQRIEAVMEERP